MSRCGNSFDFNCGGVFAKGVFVGIGNVGEEYEKEDNFKVFFLNIPKDF